MALLYILHLYRVNFIKRGKKNFPFIASKVKLKKKKLWRKKNVAKHETFVKVNVSCGYFSVPMATGVTYPVLIRSLKTFRNTFCKEISLKIM